MKKRGLGAVLASAVVSAALIGCAPTSSDGVFAPFGTPRGEEGVDGLIVGHRLMAAGEYELARDAYIRAAARQGLTVDVLSAIGSADLSLGRLGQAERNLRGAIELDETFVPAWNNLGVVLMEQMKYGEAHRTFEVAFKLDSGKTESIAENLKLALAKRENPFYDDGNNNTNFSLIRRGSGQYLLLDTP